MEGKEDVDDVQDGALDQHVPVSQSHTHARHLWQTT